MIIQEELKQLDKQSEVVQTSQHLLRLVETRQRFRTRALERAADGGATEIEDVDHPPLSQVLLAATLL